MVPVPLSRIGTVATTRLLDSMANIEEHRKSLACDRSPRSSFKETQYWTSPVTTTLHHLEHSSQGVGGILMHMNAHIHTNTAHASIHPSMNPHTHTYMSICPVACLPDTAFNTAGTRAYTCLGVFARAPCMHLQHHAGAFNFHSPFLCKQVKAWNDGDSQGCRVLCLSSPHHYGCC